jgi:hypothetical protein
VWRTRCFSMTRPQIGGAGCAATPISADVDGAVDVTPTVNAVEVSACYGAIEIRAAEQTRSEQRMATMRELQRRFVDGPVLVVPSGGSGTSNAVGATPIPRSGDGVRLAVRQKGEWGTLDATIGVLIGEDGTRRLPGPVRIEGANIMGDGWTVTVAPGWTVVPGPRSGDYQIIRSPQ